MKTYSITIQDADGKRNLHEVQGSFYEGLEAFRRSIEWQGYAAAQAIFRLERDGRTLAEFDKEKEANI